MKQNIKEKYINRKIVDVCDCESRYIDDYCYLLLDNGLHIYIKKEELE